MNGQSVARDLSDGHGVGQVDANDGGMLKEQKL